MTKADIAKIVLGDEIDVPVYNELGEQTGSKKMRNEVNLDSFYKFRVKEEVIFDKESSRLFWRILGIAPVKSIITSAGVNLGETELFWLYYPDMRPVFAKYEVYNAKNFGGRMSWEELFEGRMFYGRIIKSSMINISKISTDYLKAEYCNCLKAKISRKKSSTTNRISGVINSQQNLNTKSPFIVKGFYKKYPKQGIFYVQLCQYFCNGFS
jgi:hypothetical protein